ncbi:MAG: SAF domain-containing protein [Anaerolineales bacterium]|nr:SAF domain-containing protein [Anaerolineales bacterium]
MRRGRLLILVAIILLLGVAAVYLFIVKAGQGGGGGGEATPIAIDRQNVVIAAQDISRGAVIPENGVILAPFPADAVVETMITNDVKQVIGRYARQDIARGLPITTGMITKEAGDLLGTGSTASVAIPPGYTAIAVPMNRLSGVAYALRDGDNVDVIGTMLMVDLDADFQSILPNSSMILLGNNTAPLTGYACQEVKASEKGLECINPEAPPFARVDTEATTGTQLYAKPSESQRPRLVSQRLVENAIVLHVGSFTIQGAEDQAGIGAPAAPAAGAPPQTTPEVATGPVAPDIVTLIVTPQDALTINWAIKSGVDLVLTLRGPKDDSTTETTSVTLKYLVDNYNITVPTKLPYGLEPRLTLPVSPVLPNDKPAAVPAAK